MRTVDYVVYRYLTQNDFYNINKPRGAQRGGGGQTYIDFSTRSVSVEDWRLLFQGAEQSAEVAGTDGPVWTARVRGIGLPDGGAEQTFKAYQRRAANVIVSNQVLYQNRLQSWRPENGFPRAADPYDRRQRPDGLAVYLVRTHEGELWAGWFMNAYGQPLPIADPGARDPLMAMLVNPDPVRGGSDGFLDVRGRGVSIDERSQTSPFRSAGTADLPPVAEPDAARPADDDVPTLVPTPAGAAEQAFADAYLSQDESPVIQEEQREYFARVRRRNERAVRALKDLYGETSQIVGDDYNFVKRNGHRYVEAHHLEPLGEGGSDDPRNMVVVSALAHRMLHYADVQPIDLAGIEVGADGWSALQISVNGEPMTIRWHPLHANLVRANEDPAA